jgi:RNA polymerase sigma-70 factor (ECF subfamily)
VPADPSVDPATADAGLLSRSAHGDTDAFEMFMRGHRDAVWRLLVALLGERADAENAFQETFVAAWRSAHTFRGEDHARAWILTIARHAAARLHRRHVGEPGRFEPLDALARQAGWGDAEAPDLRVERIDEAERLHRALDSLQPEDREVIILRDLEDMDGERVAALLDITPAAMKSRLHRARLRLAAAVRRELAHGSARS